MRYVHAIARLNEELDACHTRLDDLDDMALKILREECTASDEAMLGLIEACEEQQGTEVRRLGLMISWYEYQRDRFNGTAP